MQKNRLYLLDTLRGIALISMILYHAMYDLFVFKIYQPQWYVQWQGYIWQQSIVFLFVGLSGYVFLFHKNVYKTIFKLLISAVLVTVVSLFMLKGQEIWFGILHFYCLATAITALLKKWIVKIPPTIGLGSSLLLFVLTKNLAYGYVISESLLKVPALNSPILFILGFPQEQISTADYAPIFPWIFLFWAGLFLHLLLHHRIKTKAFMQFKLPVATWLGQHSLSVYLLHQPIVYVVVYFISLYIYA